MRDEVFAAWKAKRRQNEEPAGFADGVMRQVRAEQAVSWHAWIMGRMLPGLGRVAACALAALLGLARMGQVMGMLVP